MKIIFVSINGSQAYKPTKHLRIIWNFLYWHEEDVENSLLLVGDGNYGRENGSHHNLLAFAEQNGCEIPSRIMDGAGNLGMDGIISGWKSSGFKVTTPESMRHAILLALGATERACE